MFLPELISCDCRRNEKIQERRKSLDRRRANEKMERESERERGERLDPIGRRNVYQWLLIESYATVN